MNPARLAWALCGLFAGLAALAFVLLLDAGEGFEAALTSLFAVFALVGAVIASRRPRNPIGWLMEAVAILVAAGAVVEGHVATAAEPLVVALWLNDWMADVWIALVCVWVPLLFPDGRLPSPRWRPVALLATALLAVGVLARAFGARELETSTPGTVENPYALPGAAGEVAAQVASVGGGLYLLAAIGALAGLVARMRDSRGVERQQLKWFAYVGSLMLGALLLAAVSLLAPERLGNGIGTIGWFGFLALVTFGLPLAMGTAILRHRLYDVDVVINRTLVYLGLTATLAAAYLGLVLLIGLTVGDSDLAVAGSTLAVAALFRPARARIQALVDRRFYRRRYDAAKTLAAFSAHLRDELDLDALRREIRGVVGETVQPSHVTLWLRSPR